MGSKHLAGRRNYLVALLAPVLAVAVFTVAPAAASANTTEYGVCEPGITTAPCPAGEEFVPFGEARVKVTSASVGAFVLENAAKTADIRCASLGDDGYMWNEAGVGKSHLILVYEGCEGSGELEGCVPNENGIIEGVVTDEVLPGGEEVEVTIESGFGVTCFGEDLGAVTGSVVGTQPAGSEVLTFTEAPGLTFLDQPSTITGEDASETLAGQSVFIN